MPGITVSRGAFLLQLQKKWGDKEVEDTLFNFGLELEEIDKNEDTYKIDVPANRYDLLCLRGLVNGVSAYIGEKISKTDQTDQTDKKISIEEEKQENRPKSRPFIAMGVMSGVDLRNGVYKDLIDFQDKLHQALGQNRALMAIGTHDFNATEGPYKYIAANEDDISFVPLGQEKEYTRKELDNLYEKDGKLKAYLQMNREENTVPALIDGKNRIISLPPLINSDFTKITENTKNILLEVTGSDKTRVLTAFKLIIHLFSSPSTHISIISTGIEEKDRPNIIITEKDVKEELMIEIDAEKAKEYIERMLHTAKIEKSTKPWKISVSPSPIRADILHKCDLLEDIAIAHGYNNFNRTLPACYTIGRELPINMIADNIRKECAFVGYTEVFTMALLSKDSMFGYDTQQQIQIKNPKSIECEVVRQDLSPCILKCIFSNQHHQLPLKIFEVSDVCVFDNNDVGVKNEKRLCMAIAGMASGLEDLQEAFDVVLRRMGFTPSYSPSNLPPFLEERSCKIIVKGKNIGALGIISPSILKHHRIPFICSLAEISLTSLFSSDN